ncbi:hypothetical protein HF521_000980 [Silurus meridionalis]|uniref:Peptidase S1 domain-containing protein n=1 Tax=Silurus meridionalis TaxID=175797 RepID=A0A8T0BY14_SILME|nr:hypothetical protein HF521_000980 [Silurus meridionalis]
MVRFQCVAVALLLCLQGSLSQLDVCGRAPFNTRIVGGQSSSEGGWPWQVSLQSPDYNGHFCGGTLINKDFVLTAAHCFSRCNSGDGSPSYNSATQNNDIALLRLNSSVNFTDYIRPVCLAGQGSSFPDKTSCWITGWGSIASGVQLPAPGVLQEAMVPTINTQICDFLLGFGSITPNMMCAGYYQGGKDTCQGDSGGPLVTKQGAVWVQAGITSWGRGCALSYSPGVYTQVSQYQTWLSSVISQNLPGFIYVTAGYKNTRWITIRDRGLNGNMLKAQCVTVALVLWLKDSFSQLSVCGCAPLNIHSVDGRSASEGVWPWQVSLQRPGKRGGHFCGGSLINKEWVLTAACCLSRTRHSKVTVYLGKQTFNGSNPNQITRHITELIVHPNYNCTTNNNDIALLRLHSSQVKPVCLAGQNSSFPDGTISWSTGWGSVNSVPSPSVLQETMAPIINAVFCDFLLKPEPITTNMICAGYLHGDPEICQADFGGPMVTKLGAAWIQTGITTWGTDAAKGPVVLLIDQAG